MDEMLVYITSGVSVVLLIMIYKGQIQKTVKTKNVDGVSLGFNLMKNLITVLTLVSLWLAGNGIISYVSQVLSLALGTFTAIQWIYYHNKSKAKGDN